MRILIADGDLRVRAALHVLLEQLGLQEDDRLPRGERPATREGAPFDGDDAMVVADCADFEGLAEQLQEFQPELVLLDWELPGRPAAAFLLARSHAARPGLIVLSARPENRAAALACGADDFVFKADPPEVLLAACRRVAAARCAGAPVDSALLPPS